MSGANFTIRLDPDDVEALVAEVTDRVLERLVEQRELAPSESPYVTVSEAAKILCAQAQRIYDLCSRGRLTRYRDGTRVLLDREEILGYLREGGRRR